MLQIEYLINKARKEHNELELKVYQNIRAEILKFNKSKEQKVYNEQVEISILKKYLKLVQEALDNAEKAARNDLIKEAKAELGVIENLLPQAPKPVEIENYLIKSQLVEKLIGDENKIFISKNNMGRVINELKVLFPTAEGKDIADIVKKYIC